MDEKLVIGAAREHAARVIARLEARYGGNPAMTFDARAADQACGFFPRFLRHSRGPMAGRPFELEPWQAGLVRMVFGWKGRETGLRVIRQVYLFVARKNGKSTFAAGLALLMLMADGEQGAEVYSAAADREQAGIVFREAVSMVRASGPLQDVTECFRTGIVCAQLAASYKVLSADAETKHGLNPSGVIFDELHTQPKRDLYDVLHTAIGARLQPLEAYLTTAGVDRHSICYEVHDYAIKVLEGVIDDPSFLPVLFAADETDDWTDPMVWAKANPSIGVAVQLDFLARECQKAQDIPGYQNTFRRLHLNQWTEQLTRWLDMATWDRSAGEIGWHELAATLKGRRCFGGLDLSTTTDITAKVLVFPPDDEWPDWAILCRFYAPQQNVRRRAERDRVPYDVWERDGALMLTPGNIVDYRAIQEDLFRDAETYQIQEVAYDPWNATQTAVELEAEGFTMVPFRQGFGSLSEPTKQFEALMLAGRLHHGGHPVLRWMASNAAILMDPAGNVKPAKDKSGGRIDGILASIMGLGRAIVTVDDGVSVYETRGILEIEV